MGNHPYEELGFVTYDGPVQVDGMNWGTLNTGKKNMIRQLKIYLAGHESEHALSAAMNNRSETFK